MIDKITPDPASPNAANEKLADNILHAITSIKKWLVVLTAVIFVSMAVITTNTVVTNRAQKDIKEIGASNQRFLVNFASFMQCLVVSDKEVVTAMGVDAYFAECNKLLFRNTGLKPEPVTKVTMPPTTTTTTP